MKELDGWSSPERWARAHGFSLSEVAGIVAWVGEDEERFAALFMCWLSAGNASNRWETVCVLVGCEVSSALESHAVALQIEPGVYGSRE